MTAFGCRLGFFHGLSSSSLSRPALRSLTDGRCQVPSAWYRHLRSMGFNFLGVFGASLPVLATRALPFQFPGHSRARLNYHVPPSASLVRLPPVVRMRRLGGFARRSPRSCLRSMVLAPRCWRPVPAVFSTRCSIHLSVTLRPRGLARCRWFRSAPRPVGRDLSAQCYPNSSSVVFRCRAQGIPLAHRTSRTFPAAGE